MKERKFSTTAFVLLVILALMFDLAGLIPGVETITAPIFWGIAGAYMWYKGMGLWSGRLLATELISLGTSIIPGIQALPGLTAGITAVFLLTRVEEKSGLNISSAVSGKGIKKPLGRNPLNHNGVRLPRPE